MVKVLIVDDSALVRKILQRGLSKDPEINVVGAAPEPYTARDMIVEKEPDVVILDIEMPRMDGITFLRKIMKHNPLPVVVVSSLSQEGSKVALQAIESGAVEVVAKPTTNVASGLKSMLQELADKIKMAAKVNIRLYQKKLKTSSGEKINGDVLAGVKATDTIVAIGSSTGGVQALKSVIPNLPPATPGVLIAQHMPGGFTTSFSERLDEMSEMDVREAKNGDRIHPGLALLAPGNHHLQLKRRGASYKARVKQGPRVHHQRPSADVLFESVAEEAGVNSIGVILTGMGGDGAEGLLKIKEAGGRTIGQDEKSAVVYGMPKIAYEKGAVETQAPLENIPGLIISRTKELAAG